jgi:hypothetical protein
MRQVPHRSADLRSAVSPVCDRLALRLVVSRWNSHWRSPLPREAGCKPAIRQARGLRYVTGAWLAIGLVMLAGTAPKANAANPYEIIPLRNVFGLKPVTVSPAVVPATNSIPSPARDIKLTGISTFPPKHALLVTTAPGEPLRYLVLSEGEEEHSIKVATIDPDGAWVQLLVDGAPRIVSFEKNGLHPSFLSHGPRTLVETKEFVRAHTYSHEERQKREALRVAQERAAVEAEMRERRKDQNEQ